MPHLAQTYPMNRRTMGTLRLKNLYSHSYGYTETRKKVALGTATAVMAAQSAATGTVTRIPLASITQPDVPRVLTVTPGGTSANILDSVVTVVGKNKEGKPISEAFRVPAGSTTLITGTKAFASVSYVDIPGAQGSGVTFAVGTGNALGINHRLFRNNTTVKVYSATAVNAKGIPTNLALEAAPTVVASEDQLELNTVTPATALDGTKFYTICYTYDDWSLAPVNDNPEYSTSTSTSSTSSSTSTTITTSTSTSSTSSSTSSTSSSTSSTSSSTSSTSTSTTTVP